MFDFELDRTAKWISDGGFSSVALQFPEGLKVRAEEVAGILSERTGADFIIVGSQCYGACDLFDYKGVADALIHYGHSPIPSMGSDPNVLYVESRSDVVLDPSAMGSLDALPERIGLLAAVQYIGLIPEARRLLEASGRTVEVGVGDRRICHPGQVLGCNCTAAEPILPDVDAFLFLGEGEFHPLAAALGLKKGVFVLNPVTGEVRDMSAARDRMLRRRFMAIQSATSAESFLVIVCTKPGQRRDADADRMVSSLRARGKKAFKVLMEEVTPAALMAYRADAYVNTGCPRIAMDDSAVYPKPMLTVTEAEILLGERDWEGYEFDQIRA
jgi:2-(3-amino-3-carboxypropyl)histidine synthase